MPDLAPDAVEKASGGDFLGRFREIVSDPLNLLIARVPHAGTVRDGLVYLHNGIGVPYEGEQAYYGRFSEILVINRGVHEPLEELVFQALLPHLPDSPCMLELGAYWGHYSMWLKRLRPRAQVHLVEPDPARLEVGRANFARNRMEGRFTQNFVGRGRFTVDGYVAEMGLAHLHVLHADIQGYEVEMLEGAHRMLARHAVDHVFVSTHSQALHLQVVSALQSHGLRIEVSSDFDNETTSFDGFVYASRPEVPSLFAGLRAMSRTDIVRAAPSTLAEYIAAAVRALPAVAPH